MREQGLNELAGIKSTADHPDPVDAERWDACRLEKEGTDLRLLRQRPCTIYVVMDPEEISLKRKWTRAVIAAALSAHFKPGPMNTTLHSRRIPRGCRQDADHQRYVVAGARLWRAAHADRAMGAAATSLVQGRMGELCRRKPASLPRSVLRAISSPPSGCESAAGVTTMLQRRSTKATASTPATV